MSARKQAGVSASVDAGSIYSLLYSAYGPQYWWPATTSFEVILGAILTQNTSWTNVEKALDRLRQHDLVSELAIESVAIDRLEQLVRPAGFYRRKAVCIKTVVSWLQEQGGLDKLALQPVDQIRPELLSLFGIGDETADAILLYALAKPVFVIDKYTRRIFSRIGLLGADLTLDDYQQFFITSLPTSVQQYQEYHALLVVHAKQHCRRVPYCSDCPLCDSCSYRLSQSNPL